MNLAHVVATLLVAASASGPSGAAGGLQWTVPSEWKTGEERPMRAATYQIPAAKGDADPGEIAVFYFGPGQGGAVDANVKRWVGQFRRPDGSPATDDVRTKAETLNRLQVTVVDLKGTYMGGGVMMGGPSAPKPGYRLLGAIIEGPQGPVFFKFTGPEKTVAGAERSFRALLASVKPGTAT